MFIFFMAIQAIIGALLVGVILIQKSEGGGLGVGGSPSGLMSARGAADFLTRLTAILAALFVATSIVLAAMAVKASSGQSVDTTLVRPAPVSAPAVVPQTAPSAPGSSAPVDPLAGALKK